MLNVLSIDNFLIQKHVEYFLPLSFSVICLTNEQNGSKAEKDKGRNITFYFNSSIFGR
jgi:hypothetical protein